jgi:hypothetical protein
MASLLDDHMTGAKLIIVVLAPARSELFCRWPSAPGIFQNVLLSVGRVLAGKARAFRVQGQFEGAAGAVPQSVFAASSRALSKSFRLNTPLFSILSESPIDVQDHGKRQPGVKAFSGAVPARETHENTGKEGY